MRGVDRRHHKKKPAEPDSNRFSGSQDDGPERFSRFIIGLLLLVAGVFVTFRIITALLPPD